MTFTEEIKNRLEYDTVTSNLVYPIEKGYYCDALLDAEWVEDALMLHFHKRDLRIGNKYVVEIGVNSGRKILIYNHDGRYYLIQKSL